MTTTIQVSGGAFRPYPVLVGRGLLAELGDRLAPLARGRAVVIADETVAALHGPAALASLAAAGIDAAMLTVPAGEGSKSFAELERVLDQMLARGLDRSDVVVALGGGVVGVGAGLAAALHRAVVRSVEIKSAVVGEDEKEAGRRALLNLGHTFGHAIEAELGFDEAAMAHGEAVALGCALAFRFSVASGLCAAADAERTEAVVAAAGLPTRLAQAGAFETDALLDRMAGDKKAEGGRLTLILARAIGDAFVAKDVDRAAVAAFLRAEGAA